MTYKDVVSRAKKIIRLKHLSIKTERAYLGWIQRYVRFITSKSLPDNPRLKVEAFLSYLASDLNVSASTQNQAFSALLFLYNDVLNQPLENVSALRAKKPQRLPVIISHSQAIKVIKGIRSSEIKLVTSLMYGSGLRLTEALWLRIKDVNFEDLQIVVRNGKGGRDRVTILAQSVVGPLRTQLTVTSALFEQDLANGMANVYLPNALAKKYPNAQKEFGWQYVFPAKNFSTDPRTGQIRRHHIHAGTIGKIVKSVAKSLGIEGVTPHVFRHSFATELLRNGVDILTIKELMGHKNIKTTEVYLHLVGLNGHDIKSPLDAGVSGQDN